jgi:hypothetical protein
MQKQLVLKVEGSQTINFVNFFSEGKSILNEEGKWG